MSTPMPTEMRNFPRIRSARIRPCSQSVIVSWIIGRGGYYLHHHAQEPFQASQTTASTEAEAEAITRVGTGTLLHDAPRGGRSHRAALPRVASGRDPADPALDRARPHLGLVHRVDPVALNNPLSR